MQLISKQLFAITLLCSLLNVHALEPLVSLDFEETLCNTGSLGGEAQFKSYATGEDPFLGIGPFGRCLDMTAAVRHGGDTPQDPPSGGAVIFNHPALNSLDSFTVMLWAKQNPLCPDGNATRLLQKKGAWDLLPHSSGLTLMLGPGSGKVPYVIRCDKPRKLTGNWTFFAISVFPSAVKACTGSPGKNMVCLGEVERKESFRSGTGELEIGNFNGIRPFNGWIDCVRVFGEALDEDAVRAFFDADSAVAAGGSGPAVTAMRQQSVPDHEFRLPRSAIPFSTRWQNDAADEVMKSFNTTHCLWVYGSKTEFIQRVKNSGVFYQGTLNGLQGLGAATTNLTARGDLSGRHEDLDGNKNMPHWMVTFSPRHFTGCCNNPAFRERFFADAKKLLDAGVDSIHVDDWEMNGSWVFHGGVCFCESCRNGFREWMKERCSTEELKALGIADIGSFDYREHLKNNGVPDNATYRSKFRDLPLTPFFTEYQIASMRRFYIDFRKQLNQWSPNRYIPVSVNALLTPRRMPRTLHAVDVIDFIHGESSQSADYQDARSYITGAEMANAVGISQIVSPIPRSTARTRAAIATAYALGQFHLVPWDVYMGSDATGSQPRYFGTREQYGDLYDFIHAQKELLDECESVAEIGVLVNCDEPRNYAETCFRLASLQLPFHIIPAACSYSRIPLQRESLDGLRLLIETETEDSLCKEDGGTLESLRNEHLCRFIDTDADVIAVSRLMQLDLLRFEGPENVYAFLRMNRKRNIAAIHLVNWNFQSGAERSERYTNVALSLQHPERWGGFRSLTLHSPEKPSIDLETEKHADCIRIPLDELNTWSIIEIDLESGPEILTARTNRSENH